MTAASAAQFGLPRAILPAVPLASDPSGKLPDDDGGFRFCRVWFRNGTAGDGDGWYVDYPRADENLSIRLMELTKAPVTQDGEGNPSTVIVRLDRPGALPLPVPDDERTGRLVSSNTEEAANLRAYLLKGGFLWVDDFWGGVAWRNWENQIGKALPRGEYPIVDLTVDHTMFRMLFPVHTLPQIPNVGLWRFERRTSERIDSDEVHVRGIHDQQGRVMVLMTHNTDFGDAYERESDDPSYFQHFSINGYAIGIDVLLYAMTH